MIFVIIAVGLACASMAYMGEVVSHLSLRCADAACRRHGLDPYRIDSKKYTLKLKLGRPIALVLLGTLWTWMLVARPVSYRRRWLFSVTRLTFDRYYQAGLVPWHVAEAVFLGLVSWETTMEMSDPR